MLLVTVRLLPQGDELLSREVARAYIVNDGTGTEELGNYHTRFLAGGKTISESEVRNHLRAANVWDLVEKTLLQRRTFDSVQRDRAQEFWDCVDRAGEHWFWTAPTKTHMWEGKARQPALVAWAITYGAWPEKYQQVRRTCDEHGCIRPHHHTLRTASQAAEPLTPQFLCPKGHPIPQLPLKGEAYNCATCNREARQRARNNRSTPLLERSNLRIAAGR